MKLIEIVEKTLFKLFPFPPYPAGIIEIEEREGGMVASALFPFPSVHPPPCVKSIAARGNNF